LWSNLNKSVSELISPELVEKDIEEIARQQDHAGGQNILVIVAADSARRRAYYDLAKDLSSRCTNPLLSLAWERWDLRAMRRQSASR